MIFRILLANMLIFSTVAPVQVAAFEFENSAVTNVVGSWSNTGNQTGANGEDGADGKPGEDGKPGKNGQSVVTSSSNAFIQIKAGNDQVEMVEKVAPSMAEEQPAQATSTITLKTEELAVENHKSNSSTPEEISALKRALYSLHLMILKYVSTLF